MSSISRFDCVENPRKCDKYVFNCPYCGIEFVAQYRKVLEGFGCRACNEKRRIEKIKATKCKRYGDKWTEINQSIKKSLNARTPEQREETRNKIKNTCFERYGGNFQGLPTTLEKRKKTCLERYGTESAFQNKVVQEKAKQTCLEKYGVQNVYQAEIIKDAIKQTWKERYGVENPMQADEIKAKAEATFMERYGSTRGWVNGPLSFHKYLYDNITFDSTWEIIYYVHLKQHGIDFNYHPAHRRITYKFEGKEHNYYPDFEVQGKLVEIKSDYLFAQMQKPGTLENAKYIAMLQNNVTILQKQDLDAILTEEIRRILKDDISRVVE